MMVLLGYCGYRCDLCPAHKGNLHTYADRVKVSQDFRKYYGIEIEPDGVACDGCLQSRDAPNPNCPVRPCAIERGHKTCVLCKEYGCEKLQQTMNAIRPIAAERAQSMPADDYERDVRPFIIKDRLDELRRPPAGG
jgi:hypothetical protein